MTATAKTVGTEPAGRRATRRAAAWGAAVVVAWLGPLSSACACTAVLAPVERVIAESDAILLVRVIDARAKAASQQGIVTLRVLDVLKGDAQGALVEVRGRIRDYVSSPSHRPPYEQIDCAGRTPGCGSCYAYDYRDDAAYLLLVKDGTPYWAPLSPTNEEVSGPADPWVLWVKRELARPRSRG